MLKRKIKRDLILLMVLTGIGAAIILGSIKPNAQKYSRQADHPSLAYAGDPFKQPIDVVNYKNGSYTGKLFNGSCGNVQIGVSISGHQIKTINFLTMPDDSKFTKEISAQAEPLLVKETLRLQSSNKINILTGATCTSKLYKESLKTALEQTT
jgi:uncharacterized protein with FMN-binding domain